MLKMLMMMMMMVTGLQLLFILSPFKRPFCS